MDHLHHEAQRVQSPNFPQIQTCKFSTKMERQLGANLDWFTIAKHQSFLRVKGVGTHHQSMLSHFPQQFKCYLETFTMSFILASGDPTKFMSLRIIFLMHVPQHFKKNNLYVVDDVQDMEHSQFISWQKPQIKFGFLDTEAGEQDLITWSVMHEWPNILERN